MGLSPRDFVERSPSRSWLSRQLVLHHGEPSKDGDCTNTDNNRGDEGAGGGGGSGVSVNGGGGRGGGAEEAGDSGGSGGRVLVDVFRRRYPKLRGAYTCWNVSAGAQLTNFGSRLDYFLTDTQLAPAVLRTGIAPAHQGSDHAPVFITFQPGLLHPSVPVVPTPGAPKSGSGRRLTSANGDGCGAKEETPVAVFPSPPLASSVMLAGSGRQGRLDGFFVAAAAGVVAGAGVAAAKRELAAAGMGRGGLVAPRTQPPIAVEAGGGRGGGRGGVKRNHGGGTRPGPRDAGDDKASIKSFFKPRWARGPPAHVQTESTELNAGTDVCRPWTSYHDR